MTNPNNAVGTNAAFGGRTSVNAFNDVASVLSRGIITGWVCSAGGGMSVNIGGTANTRDVAIALDNSGNKTTINNISDAPINLTIDTAPATNSRYDLVVAYVDNPAIGTSTDVDNPGACGIIVVKGTASSSPVVPNDSAIRTAITSDGASGSTAYYVVLAQITVGTGVTVISSGNISQSAYNAGIATANIQDGAITTAKIGASAVTNGKLANNAVTTAKISNSAVTAQKIDFSTVVETVGSGNSICYKFADGRMLALVKKTVNVTFAEWGNIAESETIVPPNYAVTFLELPNVTYSVQNPGLEVWCGTGSGRTNVSYAATTSKGPGVVLFRIGGSYNTTGATINWQAWGRWK